MYKKSTDQPQMANLPYFLDSTLDPNNRWVKLAHQIPWTDVEELYALNFKSGKGPKALSARVALGSLIIQIKLCLSDEETVLSISENPYLQYFIGLEMYKQEAPFDPSMMTHFRKRLNPENVKEIDSLLHEIQQSKKKTDEQNSDDDDPPQNKGQLIVDATCAPADIHYPTDLGLLNQAREKTEKIIDILWKKRSNLEEKVKPRTYRKAARKKFTAIIAQKRVSHKKRRSAIDFQLNCVRRNLTSINKLKECAPLSLLRPNLYKDLLVLDTLYRQQQEMFDQKKHSVDDRIVSIQQPHIRPIVRGKAGAFTEFGAKLSISLVDGWSFVDTISFDAYNEGGELERQINTYKERFGYYPESVHADKIYKNRVNRKFCQELGIRLSGPKLGRPTKDLDKLKAQRVVQYRDEGIRNAVEGRFGVGKRRYCLDKIMAKLKTTAETTIALIFMVMNLERGLSWRLLFYRSILCEHGWRSCASFSVDTPREAAPKTPLTIICF